MLSEATFVTRIVSGLVGFLKIDYVSNHQKANTYVAEVLNHVKAVINSEDIGDEQIAYSHKLTKTLYDNVASSLGDIVSSNDLAKIRQALSAARVYYWVRLYSGKPGDEIIELVDDRIKRIRRGEVRHHSNEYIIKKIKALDPANPFLAEREVQLIHANCLADISELEELHLSVVKSKVRKW